MNYLTCSNSNSTNESYHVTRTCNKNLIVALEFIIGSTIVGIGTYLASMYGVGAIGLVGIGGGGAAGIIILALTTIIGINRKTNNSSIITGTIFIHHYDTAGALGADLRNLSFFTPEGAKIERTDQKDWRNLPNEMLIQCQIIDIEGRNPRLQDCVLYLPFCLFVKNDDYTKWKEQGNKIEFIYEGQRYELTLDQLRHPSNKSLKEMIELCLKSYNERGSRSVLTVSDQVGDPTEYLNPLALQQNSNTAEKAKERKQKFYETFSNNPDLPDLVLPSEVDFIAPAKGKNQLVCSFCGFELEEIQYFFADNSFAIYAKKKKKEYMEESVSFSKDAPDCFSECLFMMDYNEFVTKEKIENGKRELKNGQLTITLENE